MKKFMPALLLVLVFGGYVALQLTRRPAPTPDVFAAGYTLEQAEQQAAESGKAVLVLATADWCGPCQALKRGPMTDPAVVELIEREAVAVYLEDATDRDTIAALRVSAYPTTVILRGGEPVATIVGGRGYLGALREALDADR